MKRLILVLVIVSSKCLVINGENSTVNPPSSSTSTSLGKESALEKGAKPLNSLVHGFLDSVQKYDFISDDSDAKITFKEIEGYIRNGTFSKFQDRWQDLVGVFGGFAACVVVGLLFAIFMPIIGLFFCCCYCCCKRCGKAREKSDPKSAGCKRATFCLFLAVFATLMLTGGIVSIIANELLHNKLQNSDQRGPVQYWRSGLSNIISYGDATTNDLKKTTQLIVSGTVHDIKLQINDNPTSEKIQFYHYVQNTWVCDEHDYIPGSVQSTIDTVQSEINASALLSQTEQLGTRATQVYSDLKNITSTLEELISSQNNLSSKISEINQNFTSACNSASPPVPTSSCPQLPNVANNFTAVGNLASEIEEVSKSLNISALTVEAKKEFDAVVNKVYLDASTKIKDAQNQTDKIESDINKEINSLTDTVKQFTNNVKGNTSTEINKIDDYLKKYADYIWYGGLGLPCVILLTVIFYYMGILFGLCGQRPGHDAPCCNRGAGSNFFVGGVVWTFLIFWLLMYILMIMFLIGGLLYTNVCRNLNQGVENVGNYEELLKEFKIDIKDTLNYSSNSNFSVKQALKDCKDNKGIYTALELQNKFDLDKLMDTEAIENKIKDISKQINFGDIADITILSSSLNESLTDFANSGFGQIDFISYEEQLNKTPIANLSEIIADLKSKGLTTQANIVSALQNEELDAFNKKMTELREGLQMLKNQNQTQLKDEVKNLQTMLKDAEEKFNTEKQNLITEGLNNTLANVTDIVKGAIKKAKNDTKHIGQCRPLYNAAQAMTDSVCVVMLDPFNMFWFGIGWGIFFSIPSIIFALLLANMYQREDKFDHNLHKTKKASRQKQQQQDFDSPMMETYQDNIPLTSPPHGGYARSNNGEVNQGYNNDRRDDYHRGSQYRDNYGHDDYRGSRGDPYYRQGERDYPPPSYHDSRHYPSPGQRDSYPVLPQKNRY